jgi:hypothetical protein
MRHSQEIKEAIAAGLKNQQNVSDVVLNKIFENRRVDIYAKINDDLVAIQLVYEHLSASEIVNRTLHFNKCNLAVIWIFPYKFSERFYIRKIYSLCHTTFFGKVYCYYDGVEVIPVTFQRATKSIPKRVWFKEGEKKEGGDYYKILKRIRNRIEGESISLTQDFHSQNRNS